MKVTKCVSCKHKDWNPFEMVMVCRHPMNSSRVYAFTKCSVERSEEGNCGPSGLNFEPIPPKLIPEKRHWWLPWR